MKRVTVVLGALSPRRLPGWPGRGPPVFLLQSINGKDSGHISEHNQSVKHFINQAISFELDFHYSEFILVSCVGKTGASIWVHQLPVAV